MASAGDNKVVGSGTINRRYRVLGRLGEGGQGLVYKVADLFQGGALKVLKALPPGAGGDDRERLALEFLRLSRLAHPNLLRVFDLAAADGDGAPLETGQLFFTAEFSPGTTVDLALRGFAPEPLAERCWRVLAEVASALEHIHGMGLLHSDIKPANILCTPEGETKLIDLGLSAVAATGPATPRLEVGATEDALRGTIDYLAPEALVGLSDARSDLYSLGATLYTLVTGRPPTVHDPDASAAEKVAQRLTDAAVPVTELAPDTPGSLAGLIDGLVARRVEDRPTSARALLDAIRARRRTQSYALAPDADGLPLLATGVVGRREPIDHLDAAVRHRFGDDRGSGGPPALLLVRGQTGSGRRTVIREVVRRLQLGLAPESFLHLSGPTLADALAPLVPEAVAAATGEVRRIGWLRALEAEVVKTPFRILVSAENAQELGELAALIQRDPRLDLGRVAIVCAGAPSVPAPTGGEVVELAPLTIEQTTELVQRALGHEVLPQTAEMLHDAGAASPGLVIELLRAAWAEAGDRRRVVRQDFSALRGADLRQLAGRRLAKLSPEGRSLGQLLAVVGTPVEIVAAGALYDGDAEGFCLAVEALQCHGVLAENAGRLGLTHPTYGEALLDEAAPTAVARLHRRVAEAYGQGRLGAHGTFASRLARVVHLASAERLHRDSDGGRSAWLELARVVADEAMARGEWAAAERCLRPLAELEGGVAARLGLAEALLGCGRYAEMGEVLDQLDRTTVDRWPRGEPGIVARLRSASLRAGLCQRQGDPHGARAEIEAALDDLGAGDGAEDPTGPLGSARAEAQAVLGRALIAVGKPLLAAELAPPSAEIPEHRGGAALLEMAGLADFYCGRTEQAEARFATAISRARRADDVARQARAEGCAGMVAQAAGDVGAASRRYREALALAEAVGDVPSAAVFAANLAATQRDSGELGQALTSAVGAVRSMRQLGDTAQLPGALYNLGSLLLSLGDVDAAARELVLFAQESRRSGDPLFAGYLHLLAAELVGALQRDGRPLPAGFPTDLAGVSPAELAHRAGAEFGRADLRREQALSCIVEIECWVAAGGADGASAARAQLEGAARELGDDHLDALAAVAVGRVILARGADSSADAMSTAEENVAKAERRFARGGLRDQVWRAQVIRGGLARLRGDEAAATEALDAAARLHGQLLEATPEGYRAGRARDPDAALLGQLRDAGRRGSAPRASSGSGAVQLRRLLGINKRLNSELRLPILLELVLDAVIELIDAERGFVLLYDGEDQLRVHNARNMGGRSLEEEEFAVSRSIAERAARTGESVVTVDAAGDVRFADKVSVHGLRLRSVLAVPLRVKGRVVGTLYVDNRLRRGAFSQRDVSLVRDFSEQAAIAIDNARLHAELQDRQAQIEALNAELAQRVERQEAEILDMRTELRHNQQALEVRYDYSNIVGNSAAMLDLFRLLDRITDVDLPVVIFGESGTGKELVARAIHFNGPRRSAPFVSENCGAVPETLLESILFGHVKGAFTGADRDRRGLFEVANTGTLFLDEVGEMSAAMQAKLLRVLQDGEFRRVGGSQTIRADVRIIAASNKDLATLVRDGAFRQDLFYRLNVLPVRLPALRERPQDIPQLVEHFVKRYAAGSERGFQRAAMAALVAYPWPGNVRELENEVQRVLALADEVITRADLSAPIIDSQEGTRLDPDDLDVRRRVEVLERDLIARALQRTDGNQTQAAKLLGLSRYGLLKKLKRYELVSSS